MPAAPANPKTTAKAGPPKFTRGLLDDYLKAVEKRTAELQTPVVPLSRSELNALIVEAQNFIRDIDRLTDGGLIQNLQWRNCGWACEDEFATKVLPRSKAAALKRLAGLTKARLAIDAGE
jgi:hypothetical protein